ncbi:MAG: HEAT repeat domain-containing protein [Candidatus Kaelpia imicola]|nr:HEAT repeat domain-containing protein [Candidatus Kaelpia imicola]
MKYFKRIILCIVGVILFLSYPAQARRMKSRHNLDFLSDIDWGAIQQAINEETRSLALQFSDIEKRTFTDALKILVIYTTPERTYFLLEQKPSLEDIFELAILNPHSELSLIEVPAMGLWFMIKGNSRQATMPHQLRQLRMVGLIPSYGHSHTDRFWPDPSEPDLTVAIQAGGFHYVIAGAGIGIYNTDNLINPNTGERWLGHNYDSISTYSDVDYSGTEDQRLREHLVFYSQLNVDYRFIPWEETRNIIINPTQPGLIENLQNPDELIRARALRQVSLLIREKSIPLLNAFLNDPSSFVRTTASQQLSTISPESNNLIDKISNVLKIFSL